MSDETLMTASLSKTHAKGGAWLLEIEDDNGDFQEYWAFTTKAHATAYLREVSGKGNIRWHQETPPLKWYTYEWTER